MAHFMMLSDLYGRIGQMLAEHGDAPLGGVRQNKCGDKHLHPSVIPMGLALPAPEGIYQQK